MFLLVILMLLGAPHVSLSVADPLGEVYRPGRGLQQQSSGPSSGRVYPTYPSMFGLTRSEGISSSGSWITNPVLNFTCIGPDDQPYVVGPANPELCVEQVEVTMPSELFGNVTVVFDADQLSELRSVNPTDPTQYVWGLPLNKYAVPNAYYEGGSLIVKFGERVEPWPMPRNIYNHFNASATSLREYYGVDPSLQGSNETVQGSALYFGIVDSAVNTTAAGEYLALQGLVPNEPLQIPGWAPLNNISVCSLSGLDMAQCGEAQLDVEAQQAFAPQAVTFFQPTEAALVTYVAEAARSAGSTEAEIQQITESFVNYTSNPNPLQNSSDSGLPPGVDPSVRKAAESYFRDFVNNVTSAEERVQVISFSWSADYTFGSGDYKVFEDGLKNLTLSGITVRI